MKIPREESYFSDVLSVEKSAVTQLAHVLRFAEPLGGKNGIVFHQVVVQYAKSVEFDMFRIMVG